jgi:hypothetical protein
MTKKDVRPVRLGEKETDLLSKLKKKKVGESDSDRLRMGIRALARENGIKVPG